MFGKKKIVEVPEPESDVTEITDDSEMFDPEKVPEPPESMKAKPEPIESVPEPAEIDSEEEEAFISLTMKESDYKRYKSLLAGLKLVTEDTISHLVRIEESVQDLQGMRMQRLK